MSLTPEQERALDELMGYVAKVKNGAPEPEAKPRQKSAPDLLKTWLGISADDIKAALKSLDLFKDGYEQRLLDYIESKPLDATFEFMCTTAWAFYQFEKDENPKIKTYIDAFYYISTCASVGYADIFAVTQAGRAIAALVMIVGPALTNQALARPRQPRT